jgi:hypothetical protein
MKTIKAAELKVLLAAACLFFSTASFALVPAQAWACGKKCPAAAAMAAVRG